MPFAAKRALLLTLLVSLSTCLTWLLTTTLTTLAASAANTITVCPAGPPICDHATIQAGLDAAQTGDTVLVFSGSYSEQIALKSGVTLRASDGPTATVITAEVAPILTATGVVSTTFEGFTLSGYNIISIAVEVISSQLTISNTVIKDLAGEDGIIGSPAGKPATAIQITGAGAVTVANTVIRDVRGGGTLANGSAHGGVATGFSVSGDVQLTILGTTIWRLFGGNVLDGEWGENWCPAGGGNAVGIELTGNVAFFMRDSEIGALFAGNGCNDNISGCSYDGGSVSALTALGGAITLKDNLFRYLNGKNTPGTPASYAVRTISTQGTYLEGNRIYFHTTDQQIATFNSSPTPPPCPSETSSDYLVASQGDAWLQMIDNQLSSLQVGHGTDAEGMGIQAQQTLSVTLVGNAIEQLKGAASPGQVVAINLVTVNTAHIDSNLIHNIQGGVGYQSLPIVTAGGDATGIRLTSVATATLRNNVVWQILGGPAAYATYSAGGNALALHLQQGNTTLEHNVFHQSIPGPAYPGLNPGRATGWLIQGNVTAVNNVLFDQQTAVSVAPNLQTTFLHNDVWLNEQNFVGIQPPPGNLYLDPLFVAPYEGNFHLHPDSPLIEAAAPIPASQLDFEGEPRPLDGNNDGLLLPDIGADEFYPGLLGSLKTVDKLIAEPGDTLLYTFHIANPSDWLSINSAHLSDTLPAYVNYVPGSLQASAGSWGYSNGVITWTGNIPAGQFITLTFQATIQPDLTGLHVIINQASLTDPIGAQPTLIRATTLVNPRQLYFPLIPEP